MAEDVAATGLPDGIGSLVLDVAPELGRWVFGTEAAPTVAAVLEAVATVTGSGEVGAQRAALSDPERAAALRVALAQIAAGCAAAAAARFEAALTERVAGGARMPEAQFAWGAPVISIVVLLTFAAVIVVALTRAMPPGAEPVLNVLMGTLGAMATSVVGYWVGSSAGSARKDERLATLANRG